MRNKSKDIIQTSEHRWGKCLPYRIYQTTYDRKPMIRNIQNQVVIAKVPNSNTHDRLFHKIYFDQRLFTTLQVEYRA